jgi:phosphoglycolate phosphatase
MRYRLAIFDMDGTLVDSFPWFLSVVNSVADRHGFKRIEDHEIDQLRGKGSREILMHLRVPMWKLPAIARDLRKLKSESLHRIPLFPGVPEMLQNLVERGIELAIVSSDSEANVRAALAAEARIISHFACGASLFGKSQKFRRTIRRAGAAPAGVIAIGDEIRDAEAAASAGISFGAVTWGYARPEALRRLAPALVFDTVEDIVVKTVRG